jgi:hypothetical protein
MAFQSSPRVASGYPNPVYFQPDEKYIIRGSAPLYQKSLILGLLKIRFGVLAEFLLEGFDDFTERAVRFHTVDDFGHKVLTGDRGFL